MTDDPTIASLQQELSDARDLIDTQELGMDSLKEDLRNTRLTLKLAESAYVQCNAKLSDALVELENLRQLKAKTDSTIFGL